MDVRFWGTRGSLPASVTTKHIRQKVHRALEIAVERGLGPDMDIEAFMDQTLPFWVKGTYGTNTPCIEIREGRERLICDAGSGIRDLGNHLLRNGKGSPPREFHILLSHPHWDHIHGFPFFVPTLIEGTRITIYGCHDGLKEAFTRQHSAPFFPLDFHDLRAKIEFVRLETDRAYDIAGFQVMATAQHHPGKSYGYRIERNGKAIVYSTDSEHKFEGSIETLSPVSFFKGADLLIFDAQYTLADAWTVKEDWGHSNNVVGVEFAKEAGVKHLCLFHQEPVSDDEKLDKILADTRKLASLFEGDSPLEVTVAWDGLTLKL